MSHKFTFSDLDKSRKQLIITEIDAAALEKAEKKVLKELSKNLKIKGFRPGNIPESVVRENVEDSYISVQTIQEALPEVANGIVQEAELRIIGQPQINFESVDPLKIVIDFDVYPEVTIGDYKKISVKEEKKKATDKEVQEALEHVQGRMTEYKKVERAAKKDDRVEIDFDGKTPDGVPLDNTSSKHHPIVIGSNMFVPGFEDELVGMKAGDEKEFEVTFPKDYHAANMAGKPVVFAVKVHQVEEAEKPKIDDAFAEKVTAEKKTLDEWKKEIKAQIQDEHDKVSRQNMEEKFYDELIKITSGDLPDTLIQQEKQSILRELKQRILQQGLSYEKYLESAGQSEDQLLESYDKQAEDRIKLRLSLQQIADKEKVEVTEVDVEEKLNDLLRNHPDDQKKDIKAQYQPGSEAYETLAYQLKMQKTLEKILPKE